MDADEPFQDDGFPPRSEAIHQADVSTIDGAPQQMISELTMVTRALRESPPPEPWDETLVRARLETTMGIARHPSVWIHTPRGIRPRRCSTSGPCVSRTTRHGAVQLDSRPADRRFRGAVVARFDAFFNEVEKL